MQVRRLASACLARLCAVGDVLPLFARVAAFQAFLGSREALARAVPAPVRAGALQVPPWCCLTQQGRTHYACQVLQVSA